MFYSSLGELHLRIGRYVPIPLAATMNADINGCSDDGKYPEPLLQLPAI